MPFRNYIEPIAPDAYYAKLNDVMKVYDMWSNNGMFDKDGKTIDSLLKFQTTALSDAKPKKGKFPLIIYCSGWFSRSPDNSVMAEFLASHGFVVMTVPQLGTGSTVFDFKVSEERIWTQVNDLKFALDRARSFDNVDAERVAAVGFSIGGIVVLWLSQIDDRIDAIAGLDGSYVFKEWTELAKKGVTRPRKGFPILTMYRGHESLSSNIDLMFIEALDWADRSVIEVPKATHGEFSDEAFLYSRLGYPWKHSKYNTVSEATRAYYSVNHSVRAFFDAVLGGDQKTTVEDSLRKPVGAFGLKYRRLEARK
ncbi:MAG: dienelactone hydrolase family protein [Chloracidobacterium sp.]|nr:dienelactone hydrolase family protein [Chloracidobacterium sp.]